MNLVDRFAHVHILQGEVAAQIADVKGRQRLSPDHAADRQWGVCSRRPYRVGVQPDSLTLAMRVRPSETTTWQFSARKLAF